MSESAVDLVWHIVNRHAVLNAALSIIIADWLYFIVYSFKIFGGKHVYTYPALLNQVHHSMSCIYVCKIDTFRNALNQMYTIEKFISAKYCRHANANMKNALCSNIWNLNNQYSSLDVLT